MGNGNKTYFNSKLYITITNLLKLKSILAITPKCNLLKIYSKVDVDRSLFWSFGN